MRDNTIRRNKAFFLTAFVIILSFLPCQLMAACIVDEAGTYIEAEHFTGIDNSLMTADQAKNDDNKFLTIEESDANGSGKNAVQAGDNGYADNTPHHQILQYELTFPAAGGTYYIWARSRGLSSNENSMYFRRKADAWKAWAFDYYTSDYTWVKNMQVGADHTIVIPAGAAPNTHTIEIAMREKNSVLDGFFLTTNSGLTPTDATVPGTVITLNPKETCAGASWSVDPATIGPTAFKGYNAAPMTFTITNVGNQAATSTGSITSSQTWAKVDNSTVPALAVDGTQTVTVAFDTSTLTAGTHTAKLTVAGGALNSVDVDITLIIKDIPSTAACGEIPLYAENLINPAIMVQLDTSGSMNNNMDIGGGQTMSRIAIAEDVLKEVFLDRSISWGFATWAGGSGKSDDSDDAPDYYTNYRVGIHTHDDTHQSTLQAKADDGSPGGWTPLVPTMRGGLEYFKGNRSDGHYKEKYSKISCQPKILVIVTDGLGNTGTSNTKIDQVMEDLTAQGITVVAVGFGLSNASQLDRIVQKMQTEGTKSEDDYLYHLHKENASGVAVPFMAQNRQEFIDAMNAIVSNVKAQIFYGASPAPTTSVDNGAILLNAEFDASNWTGSITATRFNTFTGELEATPAWKSRDKMPSTINGFIYDATANITGFVSPYTTASIAGDNYLCKPMGDIINSTPAIVGRPPYYYPFDDYYAFKFNKYVRERPEMAYVAANDGALHALRIKDGEEMWRFYPNSVKTELAKAETSPQDDMCSSSYCHKFILDGSPKPADIYVPGASQWRTILTTGLGQGGSAFFALDITYGEDFDAIKLSIPNVGLLDVKSKFLWEFTDSDLGVATSQPIIARVKDENGTNGWATYFGSGAAVNELQQVDKEAYLFAVDSWDKGPVWVDATDTGMFKIKLSATTLKNDVPSPPLLVDAYSGDHLDDRIYLGNLYGDFYRIKNIGFHQTPVSELLYDSQETNHNSPVTAKAAYGYAGGGDVWVYFGTGKYTDQADKASTDQQYFIGLYDEKASKSTAYKKSDLVAFQTQIIEAYAVDEKGDAVDLNGDNAVTTADLRKYRTLSCTSPVGGTCNPDGKSWLLKLATPGTGSERVITQPLILGGIVFFATFIPDGDVCEGNGDSWLFAVDWKTGDFVSNEVFDINNSGDFDSGDKKVKDKSGNEQKIVGIYLGSGRPSDKLTNYNDNVIGGTDKDPTKIVKVKVPDMDAQLKSWQQNFN